MAIPRLSLYEDKEGNVLGYSIELCQRVAAQLQQRLDLPEIDIEYVFITPGNRIQLLNSGEIDIECNASLSPSKRIIFLLCRISLGAVLEWREAR